MKWCTNNCHEKAMWCGRKNCLNREDFAANAKRKRGDSDETGGRGDTNNVTKDFKIALAAINSPIDYKMLEEQFLAKE